MKQHTKLLFSVIYLSVLVVATTACGGPGGPGGGNVAKGGNDGTLSLANAPVVMDGSFVADVKGTSAFIINVDALTIAWAEYNNDGIEIVDLGHDLATGRSVVTAIYTYVSTGGSTITGAWTCSDFDLGIAPCIGITIDNAAGNVTFADQVLISDLGSSDSPITLNGVLNFTPP